MVVKHPAITFSMKPLRFIVLFLLLATGAVAEDTFPGLKSILTPDEWKRARLDRLTPDELGVIDAALIRYEIREDATRQVELGAMRETVAQATAEKKRGWLERFGLPVFNDSDWREMPPLKAKVVAWEGGNRFRLDNGQVWEGHQPITYELVGKEIEIQARPSGQYALIVEGANTTIRVLRLR